MNEKEKGVYKEQKIIAILDRSAGNESVGEMWKETKIFDIHDRIEDILKWASKRKNKNIPIKKFTGNLIITIAQE